MCYTMRIIHRSVLVPRIILELVILELGYIGEDNVFDYLNWIKNYIDFVGIYMKPT